MKRVYEKVAKKNNLSVEVVKSLYKFYWTFIKEHIEKLPLKTDMTEEEFKSLDNNFALPFLGKLYCTYSIWLREKNKYKKYKNEHKKDKTS